jgi:hypothetical protein
MIRSRIIGFLRLRFDTLFGHHQKSYENHGAAPGNLFNRESIHLFDFDFPHHLGITKNTHEVMRQHLVIILRSAALRDTLTLEGDLGVSEYLSDYILLRQSA